MVPVSHTKCPPKVDKWTKSLKLNKTNITPFNWKYAQGCIMNPLIIITAWVRNSDYTHIIDLLKNLYILHNLINEIVKNIHSVATNTYHI